MKRCSSHQYCSNPAHYRNLHMCGGGENDDDDDDDDGNDDDDIALQVSTLDLMKNSLRVVITVKLLSSSS